MFHFTSLLFSCAFISEKDMSLRLDPDQDGVLWSEDCDEENILTNGAVTWYLDSDEDGYGDPNTTLSACTQPEGYLPNSHDCLDDPALGGASINPEAIEICDGIDNNCNDKIDDEDDLLSDEYLWFADEDSDGEGAPNNYQLGCTQPDGWVQNSSDCNDENPLMFSASEEVCDNIDNDCNGEVDEELTLLFYLDLDNDGYGNPEQEVFLCSIEEGTSTDNSDCNDQNDEIRPDAEEICDTIDNDCDGAIDEEVTLLFYLDSDNDGYGNPEQEVFLCSIEEGTSTDNSDCDDLDYYIRPDAQEVCDNVDNDCDDMVDDDDSSLNISSTSSYYQDLDEDLFGDPNSVVQRCSRPSGYVSNFDDCDDTEGSINPIATEVCDGIDQNCNFIADENVSISLYPDSDGDGFGSTEGMIEGCSLSDEYSDNEDDCNDNNAAINPAAEELCDQQDNDCNELVDDDVTGFIFSDNDNDGYGDPLATIDGCTAQAGEATNGDDCDDNDATLNPGSVDIPDDSIDQDCSGGDLTCSTTTTEVHTISFAASTECTWSFDVLQEGEASGNMYNGFSEQHSTIVLTDPDNICSISSELDSDHAGLTYNFFGFDDHIAMTYNDYLLMTTAEELTGMLSSDNNGFLYEWESLDGLEMNHNIETWVLDGSFTINFFSSFNTYNIFLRINSFNLAPLHELSKLNGELDFGMLSFGDNDVVDCSHDELSFEVYVDYGEELSLP
jgi:hypothetical protein